MWADEKSVCNAMKHGLELAEEKKIKSIGIPAVGSGAGAFPIDRCAEVLLKIVDEHTKGESSLEAVLYVLYDENYHTTFTEHFQRLFPERTLDPPPSPMPRAFPPGAADE